MFSRVSTRMAAENGAEVAMEEGNERSSEIQVETLEKRLSETCLTDQVIDPAQHSKKIVSL